MFHKVVQVIPTEDYKVYVYFEDGKIVCYDASNLLNKKVFEPGKIFIFLGTLLITINVVIKMRLDLSRRNKS